MGAFFLGCGGLHSPFRAIHKKGSISTLGKHFKQIARPFLLEHHFLQFILCVLKILCTFEGGCMAFCPPSHSIFPFNLICFLLCVAHQVGPPPSFSFWLDSLNLWPTFRSCRDPPFLLRPCWGMYCFSQHHLRWFCVHCERHGVSCFS